MGPHPCRLAGGVRPGLHGADLNLADGDPKFAFDFREVCAPMLDQWLGSPAEPVLGEKFAHLTLLRTS